MANSGHDVPRRRWLVTNTALGRVAIIVVAELLGTSLWFSANAAFDDLATAWSLTAGDVGTLTIAVQAGFIIGTLAFAISGYADRHAASRLFAASAVVGAAANAGFAFLAHGLYAAAAFRFVTGLALAGIYPLGMKLVVSWQPERASEALGWLVGMLTLGTALPYAVRAGGVGWPWQEVASVSSVLALAAAVAIFALGDGPHLPRASKPGLRWGAVLGVFHIPAYRASALAYFGHMWEIYAMWTITPFLLALIVRNEWPAATDTQLALAAFAVIGVGALGCIVGGAFSRRYGSAKVAGIALAGSLVCGLVFPFVAPYGAAAVVLLLAWGVTVVADSPQFSALSARACPPELVGSGLAIQNSIGFAISIVSIQWATHAMAGWGAWIAWLLVPGPILGLLALAPLLQYSKKLLEKKI
jgi:MFS family permease